MKKRMSATERDALLRMNVALEILATEPGNLTQRLAEIPYAKRDIALMRTKIYKLIEKLTETIPDDQMPHWVKQLEKTQYYVGVRNPADKNRIEKDYGLWLTFDTLYKLIAGCKDKCLMCMLDKAQRKACPLKKAIDAVPNDVPEKEDGDCPYYTAM